MISKRKAAAKAFAVFCTPQSRNTKKPDPVFDQAESLEFSLGEDIVRGYRWNHALRFSRKALMLHGFESSIVNFAHYVGPLTAKGYEVLAFDAPAHGRSTGRSITVVSYKEMVKRINKEYGPVDAFIAHSLGGLALSLALEELDHGPQQRVVLIAPAAETRTAIDRFFDFLQLDHEVRKEFDALIARTGGHPPDWFSVARAAGNIKARVLFLQDKDDLLTPMKDVAPIIEAGLPNFRFLISEGLGHSEIYCDPKSVASITEFL